MTPKPTIICTQCRLVHPGDEEEIDEDQILVPERYSYLLERRVRFFLWRWDQKYDGREAGRGAHNTHTWDSLLNHIAAAMFADGLPCVTGDVATFINCPHNAPLEIRKKNIELGRGSLSYVRAFDALRRVRELGVLSDGEIVFFPRGWKSDGGLPIPAPVH